MNMNTSTLIKWTGISPFAPSNTLHFGQSTRFTRGMSWVSVSERRILGAKLRIVLSFTSSSFELKVTIYNSTTPSHISFFLWPNLEFLWKETLKKASNDCVHVCLRMSCHFWDIIRTSDDGQQKCEKKHIASSIANTFTIFSHECDGYFIDRYSLRKINHVAALKTSSCVFLTLVEPKIAQSHTEPHVRLSYI